MEKLLITKSKILSIEAIKLSKLLKENKEYHFADQILRSGTSVGANLIEAYNGVSRKDFLYRIAISLKEAKELEYWFELLDGAGILVRNEFKTSVDANQEMIKLLASTLKTARTNSKN